jgi:hypothetical protein
MKFGIIDPRACTFTIGDFATIEDAERAAGLTPGAIDHGTVTRGLGIIVSEYGLFDPPDRQHYFSIDRRLYAGGAVLYRVDSRGITIDLEFGGRWFGSWYADAGEVEQAIREGAIERPQQGFGELIVWRWPGPRPDGEQMQKAIVDALAAGKDVVIDGDTVLTAKEPPR